MRYLTGKETDLSPDARSDSKTASFTRETCYLLLGHRVTVGTVHRKFLPPSILECFLSSIEVNPKDLEAEERRIKKLKEKAEKRKLMAPSDAVATDASAEASPSPKILLTVGARAIAKHAHRDEKGSGWGDTVVSGSIADKNLRAAKALGEVLGDPIWMNLHQLPHDIMVYEIRNSKRFGARYYVKSADRDGRRSISLEFRGLLEPIAKYNKEEEKED
ncbi:hypothetical protein HDU97_004815 [Phlyctochytrium planicorne]|nr:hypothetical protein HDU97_004815 [Phlyctochytrium planicorne]